MLHRDYSLLTMFNWNLLLSKRPPPIFNLFLEPSKKGLSLHFPGVHCWHFFLLGLHNERSSLLILPQNLVLLYISPQSRCWAGRFTAANGDYLFLHQPPRRQIHLRIVVFH